MKLDRREFMAWGTGAAVLAITGHPQMVMAADDPTADDIIKEFTAGADIQSGRVALDTPEIAENGNTVPVSVLVESPMTADDYVTDVLILADGNPRPGVATFRFTALSGEAEASTRIRLAKTQNVIAVAKMSDGSFFMDKQPVKVTIGGCGG